MFTKHAYANTEHWRPAVATTARSMRRDMADSFHVGVGDVPAVPGLGPDQGRVGMTVQFLVDAAAAGAGHMVFGQPAIAVAVTFRSTPTAS